jgi:hypothetical protein
MTRSRFGRLLLSCGVFLLLASPASAQDHAYIGAKKCKMCHLKQFKSWQKTQMANAFELLKPGVAAEAKTGAGLDPEKDYTLDAECVSCHVTGHGKEGGFVDAATTPGLAGVGCEACHGPGGDYVADDKMSLKNKEYKRADLVAVGMVFPPTEKQCTGCHNDKSPFFQGFDFETRKAEGTHEHRPLKYQH